MESNDDRGNSEDDRLMCESVDNFERELENEENENLGVIMRMNRYCAMQWILQKVK